MHAGRVDAQYDAFYAARLEYGPSYRSMRQAWTSEQRRSDGTGRQAVAQLQWRLGLREVAVHPADLDGALQLGAMLQPSGGKGTAEATLPFAVDIALLEGDAAKPWAVRARTPHILGHFHAC